jgi:hypothetical protein
VADLITVEQLEARLSRSFEGDTLAQAEALIDDASALIVDAAGTDFATGVPGVVIALVAQVIRRALDNPGELTAENIGGYGWQSNPRSSASGGAAIYLTRAERRLVRRSAGRSSFTSMDLASDPDGETAVVE